MAMFFIGFTMFFALHVITATPAWRNRLVGFVGENARKGIMTLNSLAAIALICQGWADMPNDPLFAPVPAAVRAAPVLVSLALILFVIGGGNLPGHLRRRLHHPMLVGAILWSATHLLANGGVRETWLFGGFLAFSLYALVSLLRAGKRATFTPSWKYDAIGIALGTVVAIGVMHSHRWLFGVAV